MWVTVESKEKTGIIKCMFIYYIYDVDIGYVLSCFCHLTQRECLVDFSV